MDTDILFEEVQGSGKRSVPDFFKTTSVLFAVALIFNLFKQQGEITQLTMALFTGLVICALAAIFTGIKMITQIKRDGIYVRYPPFQPSFNKYPWNEIRKLYVRTYNPIEDYLGWGIKTGPMGKCYTTSGNNGIQLELSDNTRVLIGTQQPDKVAAIIQELHNKRIV